MRHATITSTDTAINGFFQAARRKARERGRFRTIHMVNFMNARNLDFSRNAPYSTHRPLTFQQSRSSDLLAATDVSVTIKPTAAGASK